MRIVEASLIVPLTILIMSALIALMMSFYSELGEQIDEHNAKRDKLYEVSEMTYVRAYDRLSAVAVSANASE